jgi:hypothetical protein
LSTSALCYPPPPEDGGKLTSRLTASNWRRASAIRFHEAAGFLRVYVVGHRYYDRSTGSFMGGRGSYVFEGRVVCESYPRAPWSKFVAPEVRSVAGWGFTGSVSAFGVSGPTLDFADPKNHKRLLDALGASFWTVREAIAYANGEADGLLASCTESTKVRKSKLGYRVQRIDA